MRRLALIPILLPLLFATAAHADAYDPGRLSFSVDVRGERIPYRTFFVTVLPGKKLEPAVVRPAAGATFEATASAGAPRRVGPARWEWTAPETVGRQTLRIHRAGSDETMTLHVFVLAPLSRVKDGAIEGYRVGAYPAKPLKGLEIYRAPRGLIRVTKDDVDVPVSPHFTLGQFLCKQESGWPKFVVLRERLLLKLELVLEQVNARGIRADSFHVMSGYRTPYYNKAIGNVQYSRHVYGGAADIYIDVDPRDGVMDDLDGNGTIDVLDAGVLYDLVDDLYGEKHYEPYVGGLGRYRKNAVRGPFVHVDVRGFRARWGT